MPKFSIRKAEDIGADYELVAKDLNPKTKLQAVEASIAKHETIVKWIEKQPPKSKVTLDGGNDKSCGLCKLYIDDDCVDCPIYAVSGQRQCHGTPYWDAEFATNASQKLKYEKREVEFLKKVKAYVMAEGKLDAAQSEFDKAEESASKLAKEKSDDEW